ncbi:UPF0496 protein 1-like [Dioscorea cayenensis subsp. rotundata]|uniref:UPF0496 protein 1-like n=1 Tax=Dioscorea cayennensis subsp. rotundata TaxID=55577 RepID=A0AB40BP05_DIOCR|nr:UPF0496 protein 1-like [Dioscorea cayenensis subsp. rotundata]
MLEKLNNLDTMRFVLDEFKLTTVLDGLRRRKHDLEDKLGRIKAWTNAWTIGQWIAKFGVTVLSVLIPVAGVRPAATAANNGAGGVIALLQPLVDSYLAGQQSSCEDEIGLTEKILNEACFIFHRVKSARVLVKELQDEMGLLAKCGEFIAVAGEDEDGAVSREMDKIKCKAGELVDKIENLEKEVDCSCVDLRGAALTLLQTMTEQVGNSQQVSIEIPS